MSDKNYCCGIKTTGYGKGNACCAIGKYKCGDNWYCKNHLPSGTYDELHNAYEILLKENKELQHKLKITIQHVKNEIEHVNFYIKELHKVEERLKHCQTYFEESIEDCNSPGTRQTLQTMIDICRGKYES